MVRESRDLRTAEWRVAEARDSVVIEVRDTVWETITLTITRNEAGDTTFRSEVRDRLRIRSRDNVAKQSSKVEVRTDTVYVAVRDSVYEEIDCVESRFPGRARNDRGLLGGGGSRSGGGGRVSAFVQALKWVFAIALVILALVVFLRVWR